MELPLISVIVPVYNVEKYLKKCVDSLLAQSYENIEIILVDDGSKDNSGIICDEYVKLHENIKVIHKNNAGLGFARNSGLEIIEWKYVTFVDSDDWASEDLIKHMYSALVEKKVDFCKSGFRRVRHDGKIVSVTQYNNEYFKGDSAAKVLLPRMVGSSPDAHDSLEMCVCGVLYNANIIKMNNIKFPSERDLISEDLVFNIDYMQYADGACSIESVDYNYRINDISLTHRYMPDKFEKSIFFFKEMQKKLQSLGYDKNTMLRLDRMFFIHLKMCIAQERSSVSEHDKNTSIMNIKRICDNDIVIETINKYPIKKLGVKQKFFLRLIKKNQSWLLYQLFERLCMI